MKTTGIGALVAATLVFASLVGGPFDSAAQAQTTQSVKPAWTSQTTQLRLTTDTPPAGQSDDAETPAGDTSGTDAQTPALPEGDEQATPPSPENPDQGGAEGADPELDGLGSEAPQIVPGTPTLAGQAKAGSVLTVTVGAWEPQGVTLSYEWLRNGAPIAGATAASYTVTASDRGKQLSARVTGTFEGAEPQQRTTQAVTVLQLLTTPQPSMGGTSKVNSSVTAVTTGWTAGTALSYQWHRNGAAIAGSQAKKSSYKIVTADWCQTLTVKVTGTKTGYEPATVTSRALTYTGCAAAGKNRIYLGQRLERGKQILSTNGKHAFKLGNDGRARVYNHGRARVGFSPAQSGITMKLTPTGNLTAVKGNKVVWQTKTSGKGVSYAAVTAQGEFALFKSNGKPVWKASSVDGKRRNNKGVPKYSQLDGRWNSKTVGRYQFGPSGCVPTAFSMAANAYGLRTTPLGVGIEMNRKGDFNRTVAGAGGRSIVAAAKTYALKADPLKSQAQIRTALAQNRPVIALVAGPSQITRPGSTHAVVLTGYRGGYTTVKNPWGNTANQSWAVSTLWQWQSWDRLDRNAGAVFFAIG